MKRMRLVLTLALAAVLIVSGGMFIHQLLDYRAGDAAYEEAAEIAKLPEPASEPPEASAEAPAAEPTPEPSAEPQTDPLTSIDLAALQAVNADVLGWLSIPDTAISYPLVQGADGGELQLAGERSVVVEPGDTVWSIAGEVAGADQDVRTVVDAIEELNDLEGSALVPGQVLALP